jgi:hypothetical protein
MSMLRRRRPQGLRHRCRDQLPLTHTLSNGMFEIATLPFAASTRVSDCTNVSAVPQSISKTNVP